MKLRAVLSAICVLASSGLAMAPRFSPRDVVRQVRSSRSLPPAMNCKPLPESDEFLIDTSVTRLAAQGSQYFPAVAFGGGSFLMVWQDDRGGVIFGARVTPQGAVLDSLGILITQAPGDRSSPDVGYDGTNFLVVWEEDRDYSDWDIIGARVTPEGVVLDPAGIAISSAADDQTMPAIAFDGANFCVVWEDTRVDTLCDIYGARVTPDGVVLDPVGIPISTTEYDELTPAVAHDGTGFFVAWEDYRADFVSDIYGARMTAEGLVLDTSGIPISTAANVQMMPVLAFDGTNLLVAWEDFRSISSFDVYGARVTPAGTVLEPDGFVISQAAGDQYSLAAGFDGENFLVAWGDLRSGSKYDIYGARVTPQGTVLDLDGSAITQAANDQYYPVIGFDGANYLVAWEDDRGGSGYDIYGGRVTPAGAQLDPAGFLITQAANAQGSPAVAFDGTEFLVAWEDDRNGLDIYGARVTLDGTVLDPTGFVISQATEDQRLPTACFDGSSFLVAWEDFRNDAAGDIYAARVTPDGEVRDLAGFAISQTAHEQLLPAAGFDGTNSLVVWADYRDNTRFHIYGARVTPDGTVLEPSGIPITTEPGYQYAPAIAFDSLNLLVAWQDSRSGSNWDIYGTRVTSEGEVLDPAGIALSQAANHQRSPALGFDGTNFLLAWEDNRSGYGYDIFGARVTSQGEVLDDTGFPISTYPLDQLKPSLAFDGADFFVEWQDYRNGIDFDIYGAVVSPEGDVSVGGPVAQQQGDQMYPRLCAGDSGKVFLVYAGWAGTVGGKGYNAQRIWGNLGPRPPNREPVTSEQVVPHAGPTIVRGVLFLPSSLLSPPPSLFSIDGRKVLYLLPGANDVSALSPGVYFVRAAQAQAVRKVILTR
ncbi:hypothetical protein JXD38_10990 [candidate division WOR-3 bacterium]|nr:hypothetical protein [candidate division WOR-3 bacterium]